MRNGAGTITDAEFGEDPGHVVLDRTFGLAQGLRYLPIAVAACH